MLLARAKQRIDSGAQIVAGILTVSIEISAGRNGKPVKPGIVRRRNIEVAVSLTGLVRTAHRKLAEHCASPLQPERHGQMTASSDIWTRQRLAVGLLAPDIQKALLQGTAPDGVDAQMLLTADLPLDWDVQRRLLGMAG
jgi:hypothetical protein